MNEDLDLTLYADADALVAAATHELLEIISLHLADKGICYIALTGGTLGTQFSESLVAKLNSKSGDFSGLHIFFSDERFVATTSPLRNSLPVRSNLQNSSVTVHEVRPSDDAATAIESAASYAAELREITMDICILGLGPDGHVASLFPNQFDHSESAKAMAVLDSPKPPAERITFSMNFINQSDQVWIIAAGSNKADAVTQVVEGDLAIPAAHVSASQLTRLIADAQAFFAQ